MNKVSNRNSQVPNKFRIPNVKIAGTEISRILDLIIESLFGIWCPGFGICSSERLDFDRKHRRQIAHDRLPVVARIG
jgi:hypothetical protein